jgi:SAM-dependent methyltransferase
VTALQDWEEVGVAVRRLRLEGLPGHLVPEKNWDLSLLVDLTAELARDAHVADMGCAGLYGVELLSRLGFRNVSGLDLSIPWQHRLRSFRRRARKTGYTLYRRDITKTRLRAGSFDALSCLSVIEHGVDPAQFAAEAARLLRTGGRLLVTTDFWPDPPNTGPADHFGLPWRIFGRDDLNQLVLTFASAGLRRTETSTSDVNQAVVHWSGCDYTFVALTFVRV